jgi:hypothetical protein
MQSTFKGAVHKKIKEQSQKYYWIKRKILKKIQNEGKKMFCREQKCTHYYSKYKHRQIIICM